MNLDPGLPGKSFEGGIELFSQTNELDLIRSWLLEAPETVRILRVSHRVWDGADIFTVCCDFEPAKTIATPEDYRRVLELWAAHTAPLGLPKLTWAGPRDIKLHWFPNGMEAKARDELSTAERVEEDFQLQAQHALSIWKLLHGTGPQSFRAYYGSFSESFVNIGDLPPPTLSSKGLELTPHSLELSILDSPDIWFYVLAKALNQSIASPLVSDFAVACLRLQSGKLPDLSSLAANWDHQDLDAEVPLRTSEDRDATSTLVSLAVQTLEELLVPRLQQVNDFIRLTEQAEPDDGPPPGLPGNLPDPD